ncbi:acyltransferase [Bacillus sp. JJ1533]|uniref:acyltransferase n=1 Tax=Bacillus sp. JJ1533 TaxID=3122959 RepID=UPI002FFE14E5
MSQTTNNNAVDVMKFVCAILVVIIHAPPLLSYNETANFILVDIIARIAVPFFFVCAGYFFFNKVDFKDGKIEKNTDTIKHLYKYIKHFISIYVFWTIFYLLWWIPLWHNGGYLTIANLKGYILSILISGSYYHLWYLLSLIYGMIFTFVILKHVQVKLVILIAVIFYLIGTYQYSYTWLISENFIIGLFNQVYGSLDSISIGIFRAFPYLIMGLIFSKCRIKISPSLSAILSVLCITLLGLEVWLLKTTGNSSRFSYVLLTGVTVFFIFHAVSKIKLTYNQVYPKLRKMSSIIYFVHPMFININGLILSNYFNNDNSTILFISVTFYAILFSLGLIKLSQTKQFLQLNSVY